MRRARLGLLLPLLLLPCACESGSETVEIEDFDADHGLRRLAHDREYDFEWVNPRLATVVRVLIPTVDPNDGSRGTSECSGVLISATHVLTAAHCLRDSSYLSNTCIVTEEPPAEGRGRIQLDYQFVQDSAAGQQLLGGTPTAELRTVINLSIRRLLAHPRQPNEEGAIDYLFDTIVIPGTSPPEFRCSLPEGRRQFDAVIFEIDPPPLERDVAPIRSQQPLPGELVPVIHNAGTKKFAVVNIHDTVAGRPGQVLFVPDTLGGLPTVQAGSSGGPVFDSEGFVVGVVSQPVQGDDACGGCVAAASISSLLGIPSYRALLPLRSEVAGTHLVRFRDSGFGVNSFTPHQFGPLAEQLRSAARRPTGGTIATGYSTDDSGRRILAVQWYDSAGDLVRAETYDVPDSDSERGVRIVAQPAGRRGTRWLIAGNSSAPDSITLMRVNDDGTRDTTFGTGGFLRLEAGLGVSTSSLHVLPSDGSILVVGHASIEVDGGVHGTPVVFSLSQDGQRDPRCGDEGLFIWRPEGLSILDAETVEQWVEAGLALTYDMVVADSAMDADGGLALVGHVHLSDFHARTPWIGRIAPDCSADESFGPRGSGVYVIGPEAFGVESDNAWLSTVLFDATAERFVAAGTYTVFSEERGAFWGSMYAAAFTRDGEVDAAFGADSGTPGGAVVTPGVRNEGSWGIALVGEEDARQLIVVGDSDDQDGHRMRLVALTSGGDAVVDRRPDRPQGVSEIWAVDVVPSAEGPSFSIVGNFFGEPL